MGNISISKEDIALLKKRGEITKDNQLTYEGCSLFAVLEADLLFMEMAEHHYHSMEVLCRIAERLLSEVNIHALVTLLKEVHEMTETEEPICMDYLNNNSHMMTYYMEKLIEDWRNSLEMSKQLKQRTVAYNKHWKRPTIKSQ